MASDRDPSRHTEVERKYAVFETTVSPSFAGLSAVARVEREPVQHLDAVYFDTPGHELAAHRITLRRRTGGPDAGWHLKLPAGADARTEVRVPLTDGDAVPDELTDVVLAIVRQRPLVPVARIETARTVDVLYAPSGAAVAEFCDDQVTASAATDAEPQVWREWELELVEAGDAAQGALLLDRLANRLLDAGAEPAGHGSKVARVLANSRADVAAAPTAESADPVRRAVAELLEELLVWDRAVRADAWDSVHQLRVVTRKLRSLLRASEQSFGLTDDAWVLEELRLFAGILGSARDAEVLAERYERALEELPAELVRGPVRERLVDGAKRRYQAGLRRSLTAMRSERYFRLLDALDALVTAAPELAVDGTEPAPTTIDEPYWRVRKAMKRAKAADADPDVSAIHRDETLHKVRKRAKQLRYTAAALGQQDVADRAKTIQSLLGDHQDSVVSRVHLAQEALAAHDANEDTFTYGLLYQQEAELALRCEEQLDAALKRLKKAVRS